MTSPLDIAFIAINIPACAIVCWYALCGLNACTRQTPLATRLSFAAIAVGAFAAVIRPPEPDLTDLGNLLVMVGIAVGFLANRRQCVCLNCPARSNKRKPAPLERHETGGHPA